MKGQYVVLCLLALTGVIGSLFVVLGPRATRKSPGVLHVGLRYADEFGMAFARHGRDGPGARIRFIGPDGDAVHTFEGLKTGRNLVPIGPDLLPDGRYTARLSAPGYREVSIPVVAEGRMLRPAPGAEPPDGAHADENMIGVRLRPADADPRALIPEGP